jgi:hypothetical protein
LGAMCSHPARNFVKPLCMHFFYNRKANVDCPCSDLLQYQNWLFSSVSQRSVSGSGQMPNLFLILDATFENEFH